MGYVEDAPAPASVSYRPLPGPSRPKVTLTPDGKARLNASLAANRAARSEAFRKANAKLDLPERVKEPGFGQAPKWRTQCPGCGAKRLIRAWPKEAARAKYRMCVSCAALTAHAKPEAPWRRQRKGLFRFRAWTFANKTIARRPSSTWTADEHTAWSSAAADTPVDNRPRIWWAPKATAQRFAESLSWARASSKHKGERAKSVVNAPVVARKRVGAGWRRDDDGVRPRTGLHLRNAVYVAMPTLLAVFLRQRAALPAGDANALGL
jgi:hypothetical protein